MNATEPIQRVTIYLRENDRRGDEPLYLVVLDLLRREGASGATATRGLAGFGPIERLGGGGFGVLTANPPVVIEWIDRAERVSRILPLLDETVPGALITMEPIAIHQATLRASGPFPIETTCGDIASTLPTLQPDARLSQVVMLIAEHGALAVLTPAGLIAGILSPGDVKRRGGLRIPIRLLPTLTPDEYAAVPTGFGERQVGELITTQPRCIVAEAPVAQAAATMVEWGFRQLPVLDQSGRYHKMLTINDVLATAVPPAGEAGVRAAEQATSVALVMQTVMPQAEADLPLLDLIERLLSSPDHYLVISDPKGGVLGILNDRLLLERVRPDLRVLVLQIFNAASPDAPPQLGTTLLRARDLTIPTGTIDQGATLFEALTMLLTQDLEWLPVTHQGRLSGLVSRRGILRALVQEGIM